MKTTTNNYKPILFNTEMVQAILVGRKTQTRRIVKIANNAVLEGVYSKNRFWNSDIEIDPNPLAQFLKFKINESEIDIDSKIIRNDILWVRETSHASSHMEKFVYKADQDSCMKLFAGWKPSIFMPKEACRIFLKVTNVRCERLNDISFADCKAEGVKYDLSGNNNVDDILALESFMKLWDSINAKKAPWKSNPWVWIYEFEKVEKPADFI